MRKMKHWIRQLERTSLVLVVAMAAAGCASSTARFVCQTDDWGQVGRGDGAIGVEGKQIERYVKDCAAFGVVPDRGLYETGRQTGLQRFCTRDNGYAVALENKVYASVCPFELEDKFMDGYRTGSRMLEARRALANIEDKIARAENELNCLQMVASEGSGSLGPISWKTEEASQAKKDIERERKRIGELERSRVVAQAQCWEVAQKHQGLGFRIEEIYCQPPAEPPVAGGFLGSLQKMAKQGCDRSGSRN